MVEGVIMGILVIKGISTFSLKSYIESFFCYPFLLIIKSRKIKTFDIKWKCI